MNDNEVNQILYGKQTASALEQWEPARVEVKPPTENVKPPNLDPVAKSISRLERAVVKAYGTESIQKGVKPGDKVLTRGHGKGTVVSVSGDGEYAHVKVKLEEGSYAGETREYQAASLRDVSGNDLYKGYKAVGTHEHEQDETDADPGDSTHEYEQDMPKSAQVIKALHDHQIHALQFAKSQLDDLDHTEVQSDLSPGGSIHEATKACMKALEDSMAEHHPEHVANLRGDDETLSDEGTETFNLDDDDQVSKDDEDMGDGDGDDTEEKDGDDDAREEILSRYVGQEKSYEIHQESPTIANKWNVINSRIEDLERAKFNAQMSAESGSGLNTRVVDSSTGQTVAAFRAR